MNVLQISISFVIFDSQIMDPRIVMADDFVVIRSQIENNYKDPIFLTAFDRIALLLRL